MHLRHDALAAAAEIIAGVERLAIDQDATAVATVGRLAVDPNVINTIPGEVAFSVDFRHRDPRCSRSRCGVCDNLVERVCAGGASRRHRPLLDQRADALRRGRDHGEQARGRSAWTPGQALWSGAGHDAKYLADICPRHDLRPQPGGLSHCEAEYSTPEDIEAGANVLFCGVGPGRARPSLPSGPHHSFCRGKHLSGLAGFCN